MTTGTTFAASLPSDDALTRVVGDLERIGQDRENLAVAARSPRRLEMLARDLRIEAIEAGVRHDGVMADLARATGRREDPPADALLRELIARGIDERRAAYFDARVSDGDVVLVVSGSDDERVIASVLEHGADLGLANGSGREQTMPLRREMLDVRKVGVVTNDVVVRTEIVRERKVIELDLEREELVIERRDPRRPSDEPHVTRIPIRHEEAIVSKETIVTADVHVRTEQFVDRTVIDETLRYEVLHVDEPA